MSATLASLRIRNLALVEDLTWEPSPGFIAITGETGAGKSVILGALTLLLGDRADKGVIRTGADAATVEAVFENATDPRLATALEDHGAEPVEEGRLIVKRTVPAEGAGKQFVNGSPCTLALLRALGDLLVDLHGPHDHQSLFSRDQQTRLLDSFAGSTALREEFTLARRQLLKLREEKDAILQGEQALAREIDLLSHQVAEIDQAQLAPGEEETLLSRQKAAANSQRIGEICTQLEAGVNESDDSLTSRLGELSRLARELSRLDPGSEEIARSCDEVFTAADSLARAIATYSASLEDGPANLDEIESRLDVLQTLKRKYGHTVEAVLDFAAQAAARLEELTGRAERRDTLDADIAAAERAMLDLGHKLTTKRTASAKKLGDKVKTGLKDLGFAKAEFSIALEKLADPGPHGCEQAEFQFSPNPGEPARPLRAIASSGEISRVMLALKGALADQDDVPVLVFDEIDANVGGEIAAKVGLKMKELGAARQVLCITHLPQVAARAAEHFIVTKEVESGRTRTLLDQATGAKREQELARMLGGQSDSARAHAKALLAGK
ncbi:DNA repair protein RecN [Terrimicrobium sacchariphilum]|uniref:DNA repair protein RecN n=1 Tax=Terrimicrobium sacchariphilum TaxID=690879 RepID=A0A146GA79_TERSA|nr:DNA repair protein RecN [Terrimicrobium sacchariphilum]GAT34360.1 DNA repair protein RecN [Terrimicrobium sacchariphilum]